MFTFILVACLLIALGFPAAIWATWWFWSRQDKLLQGEISRRSEANAEKQRREQEKLDREREERAEKLRAEQEVRLRLEFEDRKRSEAEQQQRAHKMETERRQQEAERVRREQEAWSRSEKLRQCPKGHVYSCELVPRCPFCHMEKDQIEVLACPGKNAVESENSAVRSGRATDLAATGVSDRVRKLADLGDFMGVGNLAIDVLMRPGQARSPDAGSRFIAEAMSSWIAKHFDIPAAFTYGCPHRDEHLDHHLRGDWRADTFPQTIIFAYVLGASRKNLPPPHDQLLPYYRFVADEQTKAIKAAAQAYELRARKAVPDALKTVLDSDEEDAETKLRIVRAHLKRGLSTERIDPPAAPPPDDL